MNIVGFHIVVFLALIACWFCISGRTAEWAWRDWGESQWRALFLGWHFDDLRSLKRCHFWLGWVILGVVVFIYGSFWYGYIRGR
jgi:hypothetical protein